MLNKEDFLKIKHLNIDDIVLLDINPRFSNVEDSVSSVFEKKFHVKDDIWKIINNIIEYELLEDSGLEDFFDLCSSLSEEGYEPNANGGEIILISNNNINYVIEGNRRVFALMILKNPRLYIDKINEFIISNYSDDKFFLKKQINFIKKISSLGNINISFDKLQVKICKSNHKNIKENEQKILFLKKIINAKHVNKDQKGFRSWNRLLNLIDKNFMFEGIFNDTKNIDETFSKLSSIFSVKEVIMKNDIKASYWILFILKESKLIETDSQVNIKKGARKLIKNKKINSSSLELSLLNIMIGTSNLKDILGFENYSIKNNKIIHPKIKNLKVDPQNFFSSLIESLSKKMFSTRGWNNKYDINFIAKHLGMKIDESNTAWGSFKKNLDDDNIIELQKFFEEENDDQVVNKIYETLNGNEEKRIEMLSLIDFKNWPINKKIDEFMMDVSLPLLSKRWTIDIIDGHDDDFVQCTVKTFNSLMEQELKGIIPLLIKNNSNTYDFPFLRICVLYRAITEMVFILFWYQNLKDVKTQFIDKEKFHDKDTLNKYLMETNIHEYNFIERHRIEASIRSAFRGSLKGKIRNDEYLNIYNLIDDLDKIFEVNQTIHKVYYIALNNMGDPNKLITLLIDSIVESKIYIETIYKI